MTLIIGLIGLKQLMLCTLELEKLLHLTFYNLASTIIIHQTWSKYTLP